MLGLDLDKLLAKELTRKEFLGLVGLAAASTLGIAGFIKALQSHAATPSFSSEAESGTNSSAVTTLNDTSASGGSAVKFGDGGSSPFLIGVDSQPTTSFSTWQGRGINTLVRVPSGHDEDAWTAAAQTAGLNMIRRPRSGTADDTDVPGLIAWSIGDEPDLGGDSATTVVNDCDALKTRYPNRPVFINYAGGAVMNHQGSTDNTYYQQASASGDWICSDIYPVTGWNKPQWVPEVGDSVDLLRTLVPSKPEFCYIECSDQNRPTLSFRAATADEMRCEIWCGVVAGANGIIYFPIRLSNGAEGFSFDGVVDAGLESEMITQNTILNDLGSILVTDYNPGSRSAAPSDTSIRVGWRIAGQKQYIIAINTSLSTLSNIDISLTGFVSGSSAEVYNEARNITINADKITDTFTPYQLHIYILG